MKTATIYRHLVRGTQHAEQSLEYRGYTYLYKPCTGHATISALIEAARGLGFTHVRFAGDWKRYTMRKTMRIPETPYIFTPPTIGAILQKVGAA